MICKLCNKEYQNDLCSNTDRYCDNCRRVQHDFIIGRKIALNGYQSMPLEAKIVKTELLIDEAVEEFGLNNIYISYSGGKDSTVLSHIIRRKYPDILHIFADTTNEYPETLTHLKWEVEENGMNLLRVKARDKYGRAWNFRRVVDGYGFPMFSKSAANAIRTYRRAKSDITKNNSLEYISRNYKMYGKYKDLNISDKCCDKLKKEPIRKIAKTLGLKCSILGILASESRQRELDWIKNGCNSFYRSKDSQCRPIAFWTEQDIYEYIERYNVRISEIYNMGYERNGCMFCGFGVKHEQEPNRYQKLALSHPKSYNYLIKNFKELLDQCNVIY